MDHQLREYFDAAVGVAREAGKMISDAFHKPKTVQTKSCYADLVTETDEAVEKKIISTLKEKYPSHKFIGEESVAAGQKCDLTDDPTWIIDPVDGTTNFVHRIPQVCVVIGLTINKEIVLGVIYVPEADQMFTARKGCGAFLNNAKLSVSSETDLRKAVIINEVGNIYDKEVVNTKLGNVRQVLLNTHGQRSYGSAAYNMCMVACGRGEAYFEYGIHIWDYTAGVLIVREAGGVVSDTTGAEVDLHSRRVLCACSETVATGLSALLTHIELERD